MVDGERNVDLYVVFSVQLQFKIYFAQGLSERLCSVIECVSPLLDPLESIEHVLRSGRDLSIILKYVFCSLVTRSNVNLAASFPTVETSRTSVVRAFPIN